MGERRYDDCEDDVKSKESGRPLEEVGENVLFGLVGGTNASVVPEITEKAKSPRPNTPGFFLVNFAIRS